MNREYKFVIDLDEQGIFKFHVDDPKGVTVFEYSTEDEGDWLVDCGYMKNHSDLKGLRDFLTDMDIMPLSGQLVEGD